MLHVDQLPAITGGKLLSIEYTHSMPIEHLLIDSRKLTVPATSLFFAIRGERHDGHQFLHDLHAKGIRQFVVQESHPLVQAGLNLPDSFILAVPDSVQALQAVAAWHRKQFQIPVIGITGSNGKTIVKEWLSTLLSHWYQVVKSPRSYNSQVGVPLSVWQINASHTIGVFEAGISKPDEMTHLKKVIQPTIGIFTNIGTAHDEGFASRQQKIAEKAKLFEHCEAVVYCADHADIHAYLTEHLSPKVQLLGWTENANGLPLTPSWGGGTLSQTAELSFRSHSKAYTQEIFKADVILYPILKEFAQAHRSSRPTQAESVLWEALRGKKLQGHKFRRQHILGVYIADFICLEKRLIIEIDGLIHQLPENKASDEERTTWLSSKGFKVIRFANEEVLADFENTITKITTTLQSANKIIHKPNPLHLSNATNESSTAHYKVPPPKEGARGRLFSPSSGGGGGEAASHCIVLLQYLGIPWAEIQQQLPLLQPVSMRLELKQGIRGCYVIDDTYNNDLAGLQIALDFLNNQQQRSKKTIILSDVLESGEVERSLYTKISDILQTKNVSRLIGIGEVISRNVDLFTIPVQVFPTTEAFLKKSSQLFSNELILVKGARTFRFERIVQQLQQKTHGTVLEINLDAIVHNLNYFRSKLKPQTRLMAMVKAFAYGSGSAEIASTLQFHRVDYLAVAYADEGVTLRENGITLPIMVMNPSTDTFQQLIDYQLEPEVYSPRMLHELLDFLEENDHTICIHLKLETGMHRLGFEPEEITDLIQLIQQNPRIQVAAIFSHLAASDDWEHQAYTRQQIETFEQLSASIQQGIGYQPLRHIVNSAGISHYPEAQFDMVRLGVGLYGVGANDAEQDQLRTVGTLKTTISQIKHVKAHETVGYGRRGKLLRDSTIATIAIGYADGFSRRFSIGTGKVWINGQLAPVVGSVCMDMTMVDITDITASEGDEVIIFGEDLPVRQLAHWEGTIPYEIMTSISERVKRVFFTE